MCQGAFEKTQLLSHRTPLANNRNRRKLNHRGKVLKQSVSLTARLAFMAGYSSLKV